MEKGNNKKKLVDPPRFGLRLLRFYCREDRIDEILGDLLELFERSFEQSPSIARVVFMLNVFRFMKWSNLKMSKSSMKIFSNFSLYVKNFNIARRVLWRNKINTTLNVISIAIGFAGFLLIGLVIDKETSYDKFHSKSARIYRTWVKEVKTDGKSELKTETPLPLGTTLKNYIPEVEEFILYQQRPTLVTKGAKTIKDEVNVVSSNFFSVLDFKIVKGNAQKPFANGYSIVLSESYAIKYFGGSDVIGELLTLEIKGENHDFVVSAIAKDPPHNSGFQYSMLLSYDNESLFYSKKMLKYGWYNIYFSNPETYVLLGKNVTPEALTDKIQSMVRTVVPKDVQTELDSYNIGFQNLESIHLDGSLPSAYYVLGSTKYLYILGTIGLLILVVACLNYVSLSIAQSLKRYKEVGIRKVVGANQRDLVRLYLTESIVISLLSTLLGVVFAIMCLPMFEQIIDSNLVFDATIGNALRIIGLAFLIGIASGVYPAFILSKFSVSGILRQSFFSSDTRWFQKGMIVFQFVSATLFISSTVIIRKQINFLQTADLGYKYDAMISVPLFTNGEEGSGPGFVREFNGALKSAMLLKTALSKHTRFDDFAIGSHIFGSHDWAELSFKKNGKQYSFNFLIVDPFFLDAFNITMTRGEGFDSDSDFHKNQGVILNEAAVDYFGLNDPIGKKLPGTDFGEHRIIGVVKDFNFKSLHESIAPLVITQNPNAILNGIEEISIGDYLPKLTFRYKGSVLSDMSPILQEEWQKLFPSFDMSFDIIEQQLLSHYHSEQRMSRITSIATLLSIVIASLGVIGLTLLFVNQREREIGIRRVLGASYRVVFGLLFQNFRLQLALAFIISIPMAWYFVQNWLSNYAQKVNVGPLPYILSGLLITGVIGVVVGIQSIRASRINPVKLLRD